MTLRALSLVLLCSWHGLCHAAPGDVSFRINETAWRTNGVVSSTTLDLLIDIDSATDVPAIAWGAVLTITPQPGARGTVEFTPSAIVGNAPNLSPSSTNPFTDFDRDASGMSYGSLGGSRTELNAYATYVPPELGPSPTLDGAGNLTLPDGAGLVAIPVTASADAAGDFLVAFDGDPAVTGVVFSTGLAAPNDLGLHAGGTHSAGLLTIVNPAGDYNHDGVVNSFDFLLWQRGGSPDPHSPGDVAEWAANFGNAALLTAGFAPVPEPSSWLLILLPGWMAMGQRSRWCVP